MIKFLNDGRSMVDDIEKKLSNKKNIIFEITNGCNMACKYCFESDVVNKKTNYIKLETIKNALDATIVEKYQEYMITFFGGEPLLGYDIIAEAINYANEKAKRINCYVRFNIVTNGTLLDEKMIDKFNKNNVFVFFSYDGCATIHDKYRKFKNGIYTYDKITENISLYLKKREAYYNKENMAIRMTITNDFIPKLVNTYKDLKKRWGDIKIGFALVSADESKEYSIKSENLSDLRKAYLELADIYVDEIREGKSCNRFFESIVRNIVKGYKKDYFCECGNRYIAIGTDGALYPCEGFLGYKEFIFGDINATSGSICNKLELNSIENVKENLICSNCWAKHLCGGSCYHECYMRNKDVNKKDAVVCETYKLAIETGVRIYNKLIDNLLIEQFNEIINEKIDDTVVPVINYNNCVWMKDINLLFISTETMYNMLSINGISEEILLMCNGDNTVYDIVNFLSNKYDEEPDKIYKDVNSIICELKNTNAIYITNK